ncbi:TRZ/ATZ family hydrolase [Aestuariicella hydrocarbonica]|uniref:5-methylthioadenosine/S-adenosylhomocysteine deaminase n=1 Tax=Pseudomaricurvus hydrocarbonicus TaxID=1470433 RepID=A0A9E5JTV8_9GAMM|nr:TRZ/ATZ family hydrolase [Aestuariicella hydrocarbonica]NHO64485.1 TRZ/ATZ family hydrolase [Aestuariicella hydrocarbonica]
MNQDSHTTPVDLMIHARWIIPVVPTNTVLRDCSLVIHNGKIVALSPSADAKRRYAAEREYQLDNHIITPGLVNAHNHAAMSLLRGFADDHPLQTWLGDHIWPAEAQWVTPEFVRDGSELSAAEMIRSGTTTFSDMYFFPEEVAKVALHSGMRCQLSFPVFDFPTAWGQGPDEYIQKGLALHDDYRSHPTVNIAFGPHAPYTVSDEPLQRIATLAAEMQSPIQIHLHETAAEVEDAVAASGERPIERLHRLGLLTPLTQCVHMTQVSAEDTELLKLSGAHVVHCPESNLKLASGFCPVKSLLDHDINVALGTDGAASNNDQDLFGEMRTAALLAKGVSGDAKAVDAHTALRMATLNGAKALGLESEIGSLEVGKQADITAVALNQLEQLPLYHPVSALSYSNISQQVSHVWVNGHTLLEDRRLTTLDENHIRHKIHLWQTRIGA